MDRKSQFRYLTRHFFDRFFDKDSISGDADPRANLYQTMSLLAVPGLMLTFWNQISPYFVVSYSMIVTGFVMVFKWDSLFPDRRDYLILGSLPIRFRDLFVAKVTALGLFLAIFAVSANFVATLTAPIGRNGLVWTNVIVHLSGIFGGALFMAMGFAALQGILITILPQHAFRRISPVIQMVSIAVLLTLFLIYPLISASIAPLAERDSKVMEYFPFFWFLGVYLSVFPNGNPNPIFDALALDALYGLLAVTAICVVTYAIAYRRHARSVLDEMDFQAPRDDAWRLRLTRRMNGALLPSPVQLACFRFIGSILMRSSRHQVFLAVYLAIGLSLGLSSVFSVNPRADFPLGIVPDGMLELPLILSFFVVSGLRATFNIPYELPANWMFRLTEGRDSREYVTATRKWAAVYGLLPLTLLMAALEFVYWPWQDAAFHLVFESMVSLILIQVLFFTFRKEPFTCSYYPGKKNMAILAGVYLYGFTIYSSSMVALESWLLVSRARASFFLIGGVAALMALSYARRRQDSARLIYEEQSDTQLQGLGLN